jgi:hypothetical protein
MQIAMLFLLRRLDADWLFVLGKKRKLVIDANWFFLLRSRGRPVGEHWKTLIERHAACCGGFREGE